MNNTILDNLIDAGHLPAVANGERYNPAVSTDSAAKFCGVSPSYLQKLRSRGEGPTYVQLGDRIVYTVPDLISWLEANKHMPEMIDHRHRA